MTRTTSVRKHLRRNRLGKYSSVTRHDRSINSKRTRNRFNQELTEREYYKSTQRTIAERIRKKEPSERLQEASNFRFNKKYESLSPAQKKVARETLRQHNEDNRYT